MAELFSKLGIDWKLLLSQGVNFIILLTALTFLTYRPLGRLLAERRRKIELGLKGAEEAERRLKQIDEEKAKVLTAAQKSALETIKASETDAKKRYQEIVVQGHARANEMLDEAKAVSIKRQKEELQGLSAQAAGLLRESLARAIEVSPAEVDDKLINNAVAFLKTRLQ